MDTPTTPGWFASISGPPPHASALTPFDDCQYPCVQPGFCPCLLPAVDIIKMKIFQFKVTVLIYE